MKTGDKENLIHLTFSSFLSILLLGGAARDDAPDVMVVMTDGASTWENRSTIPEAVLARELDILVFAVGIGPSVNMTELRGIAGDPDSHYLHMISGFADLVDLQKKLANYTCVLSSGTCHT